MLFSDTTKQASEAPKGGEVKKVAPKQTATKSTKPKVFIVYILFNVVCTYERNPIDLRVLLLLIPRINTPSHF